MANKFGIRDITNQSNLQMASSLQMQSTLQNTKTNDTNINPTNSWYETNKKNNNEIDVDSTYL